ncbi:hypothetical protein PFISCL1PPCAC_11467, partial [Pristionchus fissidentatus]
FNSSKNANKSHPHGSAVIAHKRRLHQSRRLLCRVLWTIPESAPRLGALEAKVHLSLLQQLSDSSQSRRCRSRIARRNYEPPHATNAESTSSCVQAATNPL